MVGDSPHDPEEVEHDDLAALDFSFADRESEEADLDALGEYVAAEEPDDTGDRLDAIDPVAVAEDDERPVPLFTVTNPPGTVTVTTFMDGRVQQIELSPKVTNMTETDLADEIVVIAGLATQDARSAQYAFSSRLPIRRPTSTPCTSIVTPSCRVLRHRCRPSERDATKRPRRRCPSRHGPNSDRAGSAAEAE